MKTIPRLAFLACVALAPLQAELTLAPLFTDHIVLQRDKSVPVWGRADAGATVEVEFAGQTASAVAAENGAWSVTLAALEASAEGRVLVVRGAGDDVVELADVLVGDVWLCGGQSNMEWPLRMSNDAEAEIAAADFPLIRHIKIERRIARDPIATATGTWTVCTPETAPHFTAVGYFFARRLHRDLSVPIGLVNSNWGGTPAEAWLPPAALEDADVALASASHQAKSNQGIYENLARYRQQLEAWRAQPDGAAEPTIPWRPGAENTANVLFNGMIAPLTPAALRGVIWYQGEANADQPETYRTLFGAVIASWREQFQQPDLPFYWVQLANWAPGGYRDGTGWAFLREAQTQTLELPHTGQAVIVDIGDPDDIHPRNKQDVGDRLARLALAREFGRTEVEDSGPVFAFSSFQDAAVTIGFDHADGLRTTDGQPPAGFELAGSDGVFHPASATLDGQRVQLSAAAVASPVAVRYAWRDNPTVNLVNAADLPTVPFRTDRD